MKKLLSICLAVIILSAFVLINGTCVKAEGSPDLVFTYAKITSKTDSVIRFQYTIKNNGTSTISNLYNVSIQCFFSDNTVFNDTGDKAAGGSILGTTRSLAPGQSYTGTFAGYGVVPTGKNYLTFMIDWGKIITESNETNNTSYISTFPGVTKMVDMRPEIEKRNIAVRNQGSRGTCALFALTFLYEYQYTGKFGSVSSYNNLSEEFLNYWGQTYAGYNYEINGTLFEHIIHAYKVKGVPGEPWAPYISASNWTIDAFKALGTNQSACNIALANKNKYSFNAKLWWSADSGQSQVHQMDASGLYYTKEAYPASLTPVSDSAFNKILSYLDQGIPVAHGGPHCRAFVGYAKDASYAGGGYFIIRNSWGTGEGENGYNIVSFNEVKTSGRFFDFAVIVP